MTWVCHLRPLAIALLALAALQEDLHGVETPAFLTPSAPLPTPLNVPRDVLAIVQQAQAAPTPAAALAVLQRYHGAPQAVLALVQGEEELALVHGDDTGPLRAAEAAFREALTLDPHLGPAHLGLAQVAALRGDDATALQEAGPVLDPTAESQLRFYAEVALRAGDLELADAAVAQGLLRFPTSAGFRQLHRALLWRAGRFAELATALRAALDRTPADASLWRDLAACAQRQGQEAEALVALEAATLAAPQDRPLLRQLAALQLARGLTTAAWTSARRLLATPLAASAPEDLVLAAQAAAAAGAVPEARAALAALPPSASTPATALLAAELAVRADDQAAAQRAISDLVRLGEHDPAVLTWAGAVAEGGGDPVQAEALYRQAMAATPGGAEDAALRLAALLLRQDRLEEARTTLAALLAAHPEDAAAHALEALLTARTAPAAR